MSRDNYFGKDIFPHYEAVLKLEKERPGFYTPPSELRVSSPQSRQHSKCEPKRNVLDFEVTRVSYGLDSEQLKSTYELYEHNLALQRQAYGQLQHSMSIDPKVAVIVSSIQIVEKVQYSQLTCHSVFSCRQLRSYWYGQISLFHWIGLHAQNFHQFKVQIMHLSRMFTQENVKILLSCEAIYFNHDTHTFTKFTPLACMMVNTALSLKERQLARRWLSRMYPGQDVCVCKSFGYDPQVAINYTWEALEEAISQQDPPELISAIKILNDQLYISSIQQSSHLGSIVKVSCL